mmetsp:Transcript_124100/g.185494  ORF Transcript_124100/g.185494 Transcript_124100/m.185494 type:complete len:93 (+) Transcript_124100:87-365(+)
MDIEKDPAQALKFKNIGNEEFKKGNNLKAIEAYNKAVNFNPDEPSFYANRAACYLEMKKYNKCIDDCNTTLKLDSEFTKAYRRRGRSYYLIG